jgi:hypothetical protein
MDMVATVGAQFTPQSMRAPRIANIASFFIFSPPSISLRFVDRASHARVGRQSNGGCHGDIPSPPFIRVYR